VNALDALREGLMLALVLSSPVLLAALVVGLAIGALQAAAQIHDPAVGFVPRVAVVFAALLLAGPWMGAALVRFSERAFTSIR
jgi:flagellar biosynthetic protein FliQ